MSIKEFTENAEVTISLHVYVNDREVFTNTSADIDTAIGELGRVERHHFIENEIVKQWEELPEGDV